MAQCVENVGGVLRIVEADVCQLYLVDVETWVKLQEVIEPTLTIDYLKFGAIWAFFFSTVVGLYLFSMHMQALVDAIKKL